MANQNRSKTRATSNENFEDGQDLDIDDATQGQRRTRQSKKSVQANDDQPQDLMASVTPALQEVRRYIEGSPVRAAAIGAVAGAAIMTVFATEKGRSFAKMAYDYANPLVAKYAQEYISKAAGDMAGNAISQH